MSESRAKRDAPVVRAGRSSGMESKTGRRREDQPGKEAIKLYSEKEACPRRGNPTAVKTVLHRRQTERDGKALWDAEQSDRHRAGSWDSRVPSEPLCPREARVSTLGTGKDHFRLTWRS